MSEEASAENSPKVAVAELRCDECGKHGAHAFEGTALCLDCYQSKGSCCSGEDDEGSC